MRRLSLLEFADKINEIMPVLFKEFARRQANELYKGKLTLPQFMILDCLYGQGESKMTHLARYMNVTTAAMTGIVDRLVRDDYCARVHLSQDRRVIKIKLTPKGNNVVRRIKQQRRQMVIKIFGSISETERQDYLRILTHIGDIVIQKKEA